MESTIKMNALAEEFVKEAQSSEKILALVPTEHFSWKPHEKSMSLGALAMHIAELTRWPAMVLETKELNFISYKRPVIESSESLMLFFKEELENTKNILNSASQEQLDELWALKHGDHILMETSKQTFIRSMCFNHIYHHRGQLSLYLRLLNIPIPGMYGPSADEMP